MNIPYYLQRIALTAIVIAVIVLANSGDAYAADPQLAPANIDVETASVTLTPTDTYISSVYPDRNFDRSNILLVGINPNEEPFAYSLLRFPLSNIPYGSVIHSATLRLYQTNDSGKWSLNIDRITHSWDVETVTWNTQPNAAAYYSGLPSPLLSRPVYLEYDLTDLVRAWTYPIPASYQNYGLQISGTGTETAAREYASTIEKLQSPQLVIEYSAPPSNLVVPFVNSGINLDGKCDLTEYADARTIPYIDLDGVSSRFFLMQDRYNMYVCIQGVVGTDSGRFFGLYLDTDLGREKYATDDDFLLKTQVVDGATDTLSGPSVMNSQFSYTHAKLGAWEGASLPGAKGESAEYMIPLRLLSETCGEPFGFAISHQSITDLGVDYSWPRRHVERHPVEWIPTTLSQPRCIRVCSDSPDPCGSVSGARVMNGETGEPYAYDIDGFLVDSLSIDDGTTLWASIRTISEINYSVFDTSGEPQTVNNAAFSGPVPGTMSLVVTDTKPLMVHNLDISAQWHVEGDASYADNIRDDILKASDFLYDMTDGQMALGLVRIYQNFDLWDDADVRLYANNNFQPEADSGGIVNAPTVDPDFPAITYYPGEARMGSTWNRFNLPGLPPGLPVDTSDDWALVLAHEVGHYLLYLDDTYYRLRPDGTIENVFTCAGSAMGWVYDQDINTEFVFDQTHWDVDCKDTSGNLLRVFRDGTGRTEWSTIRKFYPWFVAPTASTSTAGPFMVPERVTQVRFMAPSSTQPLVPDQLFQLLYRQGETASHEARALIYRDDRVIDQGRPIEGTTEIELHGAQVGDRFCVYDLNVFAVSPNKPRHQFGCETLQIGDDVLFMKKDSAWAPMILLTPTSGNQVGISVSPILPGAALRARLYPENEAGSTIIDLTVSSDEYSGVFNLPSFTPSAYVQVFVKESATEINPRREAVVDYGAGGGGLPGPQSSGHAPIVTSSDGDAIFVGSTELAPDVGEYVAWQSMTGYPAAPAGLMPIGKAYNLVAVPKGLADDGSVSLRFGSPVGAAEAELSTSDINDPVIHFWNGIEWVALETNVVQEPTGTRLASAEGRGVGIYTLRLSDTAIKANQSILFPAIPVQYLSTGSIANIAMATSGLPVSLSSLTPGICTAMGQRVYFVSAGACRIRASQAGDISFNPAPTVERSFLIVEKSQSVYMPSLMSE